MSISSTVVFLMLHRVMDVLRTFLFIPDPFRRQLRSSLPQRQQLLIFQFLPVSAGQSVGHDDAACRRDIAFELV